MEQARQPTEKARGPAPRHTWSITLGTSQDELMIAFCTASLQTQWVEGAVAIVTHVTQQHHRDMTYPAQAFLLLQNFHICTLSNISITLYSQWLFILFLKRWHIYFTLNIGIKFWFRKVRIWTSLKKSSKEKIVKREKLILLFTIKKK